MQNQWRSVRSVSAFAVLASVAFCAPALAEPAGFSAWNGYYAGIAGGMQANQSKWTGVDFVGPPIAGAESETFNDVALKAGIFFGRNWQIAPRWVAGLEADWNWTGKTTPQVGFLPGFSGVFFQTLPGDISSVQTTWDASLRARLGYLVTPSILVYGTAGPALQHFVMTSNCNCGPTVIETASETAFGWTVGGGIEATLSQRWLARAEYRYSDYGTSRETLNFPAPATADLKLSTSTMMFGLAYRLDADGSAGSNAAASAFAAPAYTDWSGFHAGISSGAHSTQANWTTIAYAGFPIIPGSNFQTDNATAFQGALNAGYDWQIAQRWLAGIEGDIGLANRSVTQYGFLPGVSGIFGPINSGDLTGVRTTWDASLRARLGYFVQPSLLAYATGGLAWQHVALSSSCGPNTCAAPTTFSVSQTIPGWTIGGGLEAALGGNWRGRVEYRYADFGTTRETLDAIFPFFPATVDLKLQTHTVLFGIEYAFN